MADDPYAGIAIPWEDTGGGVALADSDQGVTAQIQALGQPLQASTDLQSGTRSTDSPAPAADPYSGIAVPTNEGQVQKTYYGYKTDPYMDPGTQAGQGDRGNMLEDGRSASLSQPERQALFGVTGKSTGKDFNFQGKTYRDDDSTSDKIKNRRVDLYTPKGAGTDDGQTITEGGAPPAQSKGGPDPYASIAAPVGYDGNAYPERIQASGDANPSAFIIHHTSGRGTVDGVLSSLKEQGFGVEYIMDRNAVIHATGPGGSSNILPGWGPKGTGLNNKNIVGMEIIANNDKDVTPLQAKEAARFLALRYPQTPLFGHGEVNPGHKEEDEGLTAKAAAMALRASNTGDPYAGIATPIGDGPTSPTAAVPIPGGPGVAPKAQPIGSGPITPEVRQGLPPQTPRGQLVSTPSGYGDSAGARPGSAATPAAPLVDRYLDQQDISGGADSTDDYAPKAELVKGPLAQAVDSAKPKEEEDWAPHAGNINSKNAKTAKPGDYTTKLDPAMEAKFQAWVKDKNVPFDPSPQSDYDMRGYYKALMSGDPNALQQKSEFDGRMHFPDTYKTPFHKTFSDQSQYATPGAPHWEGDVLKDSKGRVVADEQPTATGKPATGGTAQDKFVSQLFPEASASGITRGGQPGSPDVSAAPLSIQTGQPKPRLDSLPPSGTKIGKTIDLLGKLGRQAGGSAIELEGQYRKGSAEDELKNGPSNPNDDAAFVKNLSDEQVRQGLPAIPQAQQDQIIAQRQRALRKESAAGQTEIFKGQDIKPDYETQSSVPGKVAGAVGQAAAQLPQLATGPMAPFTTAASMSAEATSQTHDEVVTKLHQANENLEPNLRLSDAEIETKAAKLAHDSGAVSMIVGLATGASGVKIPGSVITQYIAKIGIGAGVQATAASVMQLLKNDGYIKEGVQPKGTEWQGVGEAATTGALTGGGIGLGHAIMGGHESAPESSTGSSPLDPRTAPEWVTAVTDRYGLKPNSVILDDSGVIHGTRMDGGDITITKEGRVYQGHVRPGDTTTPQEDTSQKQLGDKPLLGDTSKQPVPAGDIELPAITVHGGQEENVPRGNSPIPQASDKPLAKAVDADQNRPLQKAVDRMQPAVRTEDGQVFTGPTHAHALDRAENNTASDVQDSGYVNAKTKQFMTQDEYDSRGGVQDHNQLPSDGSRPEPSTLLDNGKVVPRDSPEAIKSIEQANAKSPLKTAVDQAKPTTNQVPIDTKSVVKLDVASGNLEQWKSQVVAQVLSKNRKVSSFTLKKAQDEMVAQGMSNEERTAAFTSINRAVEKGRQTPIPTRANEPKVAETPEELTSKAEEEITAKNQAKFKKYQSQVAAQQDPLAKAVDAGKGGGEPPGVEFHAGLPNPFNPRVQRSAMTTFSTLAKSGESFGLDQPETHPVAAALRAEPSLRQKYASEQQLPALQKMVEKLSKGKDSKRIIDEYTRYNQAEQLNTPTPQVGADTMALIKQGKKMFKETQRIKNELGMKVQDRDGTIRDPIDIGAKYFPRRISRDTRDIIENRDGDRKPEFDQLLRRAIAQGTVRTRDEFLKAWASEQGEISGGSHQMSNLERGRERQWPLSFYDHSPESMLAYAHESNKRLAQVGAYGQAIGKAKDVFQLSREAVQMSTSGLTPTQKKQIIERIAGERRRVYGENYRDTTGGALNSSARSLATTAFLANFRTSAWNLLSGARGNLVYGGPSSFVKMGMHLSDPQGFFKNYRKAAAEAHASGILGANFSHLNEDYTGAESTFIQKMAQQGLKWGGQNITETWNRMGAMQQARLKLQEFAKYQLNKQGATKISQAPWAKELRAFIQRTGITDLDALARENATGPLSEEFVRQFVNDIHGTYEGAQSPSWVDTPAMKLLFQFQKWGMNEQRMATRTYAMPLYRSFKRINVLKPSTLGDAGYHVLRSVLALGGAAIFGEAATALGKFFFNRNPNVPELAEIGKAFNEKRYQQAFLWAWNRAKDDVILSGMAGQFGNYEQLFEALHDPTAANKRAKDPMDPPVKGLLDPFLAFTQGWQGEMGRGKFKAPSKRLLDQLASTMSAYATGKQLAIGASEIGHAAGLPEWDVAKEQKARNEVAWANTRTKMFTADDPAWQNKAAQKGTKTTMQMAGRSPADPYKDDIQAALLTGDAKRVKEVVKEYEGTMPAKQWPDALKALKESVSATRPLRPGGNTSASSEAALMAWAKKNLPADEVVRLKTLSKTYAKTAERSGYFHVAEAQ